MENAPLTVEDDDELEVKVTKKDTKKLGFMAMERRADNEVIKEKSFFKKLAEQEEAKKAEQLAEKEANKKQEAIELVIPPAETAPVSEIEAPLETISKEETTEVIQPKIIEVIEENELANEPDPITDPPVNKFRELVKDGEDPASAMNEVLRDLDAEDEIEDSNTKQIEVEPVNYQKEQPNDAVESLTEQIDASVGSESQTELEAESQAEANVEAEAQPEYFENEEVQVDLRDESMAKATIDQENSQTSVPSVEADDNSNDTVSTRPTSTAGPTSNPPNPPRPPVGQTPFGSNPNQPNVLANAMAMPAENKKHQPEYHQASPAAIALFGGIIGYLVGRRRGRIKTEKKLLPIQKKLEKQVENLQFDIQEKEKKIRKVAAEKVDKLGPSIIEQFKVIPAKAEKEHLEDRQIDPESLILHDQVKKSPERIGKVLVKAESKTNQDKSIENLDPEKLIPKMSEQKIHTLSRAEIMEISQKIHVGNSSLRRIYETNLIGEKGLRRLIAVYMRGGDMQKALQNEITEHEIDFERDPAMRDVAASDAPIQGNSSTALNHLLEQAQSKVAGVDPEKAHYKLAKSEAKQLEKVAGSTQLNSKLLDIIFIVIIFILTIAAIYLAFIR